MYFLYCNICLNAYICNHSCPIECQVQGALESVNLVGNVNEIGAKKLDICTQSGFAGKQALTLECFTDGKWEVINGKSETGSTLEVKGNLVYNLYTPYNLNNVLLFFCYIS